MGQLLGLGAFPAAGIITAGEGSPDLNRAGVAADGSGQVCGHIRKPSAALHSHCPPPPTPAHLQLTRKASESCSGLSKDTARLLGKKTRAERLLPPYLHLSGVNGSLPLPPCLSSSFSPQCDQYSPPSQIQDLTGCVCRSCADSSTEPITGQVLPLAGNGNQLNLQLWFIFAPIGFLFPFPQNVISVSCALPAWKSQSDINTRVGGRGVCRTLREGRQGL